MVKHSKKFAANIQRALRKAGIATQLVGSVAVQGFSYHDVDLLYAGELQTAPPIQGMLYRHSFTENSQSAYVYYDGAGRRVDLWHR